MDIKKIAREGLSILQLPDGLWVAGHRVAGSVEMSLRGEVETGLLSTKIEDWLDYQKPTFANTEMEVLAAGRDLEAVIKNAIKARKLGCMILS